MSLFANGPVRLDTPADMYAALAELVGETALRYRGSLSVWGQENPPGPPIWRLEINDDQGNSEILHQGEFLAIAYGRLIKLTEQEYLQTLSKEK